MLVWASADFRSHPFCRQPPALLRAAADVDRLARAVGWAGWAGTTSRSAEMSLKAPVDLAVGIFASGSEAETVAGAGAPYGASKASWSRSQASRTWRGTSPPLAGRCAVTVQRGSPAGTGASTRRSRAVTQASQGSQGSQGRRGVGGDQFGGLRAGISVVWAYARARNHQAAGSRRRAEGARLW